MEPIIIDLVVYTKRVVAIDLSTTVFATAEINKNEVSIDLSIEV